MNLDIFEKNALNAVNELMRLSKVQVTHSTLQETLCQHPDFPSLSSLSDTLNELNVNNLATQLAPERLIEIPLPAIAVLSIERGIYTVIRKVTENKVEWLHTDRGWQYDSLSEFSEKWNGFALLVETTGESGEKKYDINRRNEIVSNARLPFILVCGVIYSSIFLFKIFQLPSFTGWLIGVFTLKVIGLALSVLLIMYTIDSSNPLIKGLCQIGPNTGCNNILNSKASKIWGWLSWAEIGFVYFLGGLLICAVSISSDRLSAIQILLLLNVVSLPYTLFSFYYQAFVSKQLCLLCTSVQVILWLEFFVGVNFWSISQIKSDDISLSAFVFVGVAALWSLYKQPLIKARLAFDLQRDLYKVKFNSELVKSSFDEQPTMPPIFSGMEVLTIGNSEATNVLTVVTQPFCESCAKNHEAIESLIRESQDIRCDIIFFASNFSTDPSGIVARRVLSLTSSKGHDALRSWFNRSSNDISEWSKKIQSDLERDSSYENLELHLRWCNLAGIAHTPTLFLNGVELPKLYSIKDVNKLSKIVHEGSLSKQ